MALNLDTAIRLTAQVQGAQNLKGLAAQFQQLNANAQVSGRQLDRLFSATQQFSRAAGNSINTLRQQRQALTTLRDAVDPTSRRFRILSQDIDQLDSRLRKLDGTARGAGVNLRDQLGAGLATLGAGRLAGATIRTAANFDQEVRRAAAIEGGAGTYDVLRQEIEKVAAAAAGTPTQVAQLSVALSRAGFTAKETTEALAGIVRGAEATSVSFEEMGSIAADNLRAFGLQTSETGRVVDVLTQTANKSNQTVLDLGESLKYAAPIARSLGVPLEDLAATMGLLANNGIRGSDAGTALRTGLTRLQIAASGSNEELEGLTRGNVLLATAMRSLGTQIIDTRGNLLPLDQVILRLRENLQQLSAGRRAEIAKALFGDEAGSKFLALLNSSEGQIRQMFGAVRDSGGVAEDTQKKMQGFAYTLEVLKGNIEIVGNAIGDSFGVVLEPLAKALNSVIGATQSWPKPLRDVLAAAAAAGVAVTGFTLAVKAIGGITAVTAALQAVASSTTAAGTAATVATGQVTALRVALISLTKIGVITIGVSLIVNGLQELQAARSELQNLRKLREAGGAAASFPEGVTGEQRRVAERTLAQIAAERKRLERAGVLAAIVPGYEAFSPSATRATRARVLQERAERARAILEQPTRVLTPEESARQPALPPGAAPATGAAKAAADKAAKDAERQSEKLADHQRRLADGLAQREQELAVQRYQNEMDMQDTLHRLSMQQIEEERQARRGLIEARAELAIAQAPEDQQWLLRFRRELINVHASTTDAILEQERKIAEKRQELARAESRLRLAEMNERTQVIRTEMPRAAVGAAMSGIIARTGNTGQSTGPHLDARWADRRPITAADVDRYLRVNGRTPSSFGVTSGYGPRNLFGRSFHAGVDFGTPAGSQISLVNGAKMLRDLGNTGAGGYAIEIMTAQGPMRLLHLQAGSARAGAAPAAAPGGEMVTTLPPSQAGREAAQGEVARARVDLKAAEEGLAKLRAIVSQTGAAQLGTVMVKQIQDITQPLDQLAKSAGDRLAFEREYGELLRTGINPELAREFVEINKIADQRTNMLRDLAVELEKRSQMGHLTTEEKNVYIEQAKVARDLLKSQTEQVEKIKEELRLTQEITRQRSLQQDMRIGQGAREGVEGYIQSIGTMREATAQLTQEGIRGLEDQLVSLATTGKANFQEFAVSVLTSTARMIIQQLVLRTIMGAIGGIGGSGSQFAQSFQLPGPGFMTSGFSFAGGGYTGNAPRSGGLDGQGGFLAMLHPRETVVDHHKGQGAAAGPTYVTVNVNTTTGETQSTATDSDRRRLGQDIAQVVDARIVYHRRPGGMLNPSRRN